MSKIDKEKLELKEAMLEAFDEVDRWKASGDYEKAQDAIRDWEEMDIERAHLIALGLSCSSNLTAIVKAQRESFGETR